MLFQNLIKAELRTLPRAFFRPAYIEESNCWRFLAHISELTLTLNLWHFLKRQWMIELQWDWLTRQDTIVWELQLQFNPDFETLYMQSAELTVILIKWFEDARVETIILTVLFSMPSRPTATDKWQWFSRIVLLVGIVMALTLTMTTLLPCPWCLA